MSSTYNFVLLLACIVPTTHLRCGVGHSVHVLLLCSKKLLGTARHLFSTCPPQPLGLFVYFWIPVSCVCLCIYMIHLWLPFSSLLLAHTSKHMARVTYGMPIVGDHFSLWYTIVFSLDQADNHRILPLDALER